MSLGKISVRDVLFSVSMRSRNAHGHVTRTILCGHLQEECRAPGPGHPFCASARSRNAHGRCHKSPFGWTCAGNMPDTPAAAPVLCERWAVEMHMDISQEPFCAENFRENAEALTLTVRIPHETLWAKLSGLLASLLRALKLTFGVWGAHITVAASLHHHLIGIHTWLTCLWISQTVPWSSPPTKQSLDLSIASQRLAGYLHARQLRQRRCG